MFWVITGGMAASFHLRPDGTAGRADPSILRLLGRGEFHLVASIIKPNFHTCVVELWFLMDPHESLWSKQCTITLPTTRDVYESFGKPLQVLEDGKIVVWIWKYHPKYCGVPWVYDPKTETFTDGAATRVRHAVGGVYTGSLLRTVGALV
jgi:hypothetical protein